MRFGIDGGAEFLESDPGCEVGRGRREQIAAVEGPRDRLKRIVGVGELVRLGDTAEGVRGRQQEAVVRTDVEPTLPVAQGERAPPAADPRVDDREMDARRHVGEGVREDERSLQDVPRPDAMCDVDHPRVRSDRRYHAVTRADEVVLQPEVGQEGDDHDSDRNASTRPSRS